MRVQIASDAVVVVTLISWGNISKWATWWLIKLALSSYNVGGNVLDIGIRYSLQSKLIIYG